MNTHNLNPATQSFQSNNLQSAICNLQSNEAALLGALLNRGRKVRRLPKFDQLTTAHFSNPLHESAFKRRKLRSDSAFASLTDDQHHLLQQWLHEHSYHKVVEMVAKPAPEGFGIKTHVTSLFRYLHATMHDDLLAIREDLGADFKDLAALCQADPIAYRVITRENLERHLMLLSSEPKPNLPLILRLMRALQRDQEAEFKKAQAAARSRIGNSQSAIRNPAMPLAPMNDLLGSLAQATPPTAAAQTAAKSGNPMHGLSQSCAHLHANSHSVPPTPACKPSLAPRETTKQ